MNIGDRIRLLRKGKGLTQKQLGELCGMADSAIRRYESNRGNPTEKTIKKIAAALEVDPYSLADFDTASKMLEDRINARERVETAMEQLNHDGQNKVADYAEDILPRYRAQERGKPAPAPPEGKDTTPPQDGSQRPPEGEQGGGEQDD